MHMLRPVLLAAAAAMLLACNRSGGPAPAAAESGAYLVMLGHDTLAVEQYNRVGDRVEGTVITRAPRTVVTRYVATLDPSGMPTRLEYNTRLPDGGMLSSRTRSVTVTFDGDSITTQVQQDTVATIRTSAQRAFPMLSNAFSLYAPAINAFRALNADTATFAQYVPGAGRATPVHIVRKGPNQYLADVRGPYHWHITTNEAGQIETLDGRGTVQQILVTRRDRVDVPALITMFAEHERRTRPIGQLSPRDTVNARVASAQIWLDYSRPAARGRKVFGTDGVLGDTLWRTGADAATQFRTSVPLVVAGRTIPAGTYSLFTIAVPGRYQLIFNKQSGQWGTTYDPRQDLVRVPLDVVLLPAVVDRFTIDVHPTVGNAGVIRLSWDTLELSVPFTVPE